MITIIMTLTALGLAALSIWCARKALAANASAKEGWLAAAYWQRECGCISPDAAKWRLHRAARIRRDTNRTVAQNTLKAQTTAALANGE